MSKEEQPESLLKFPCDFVIKVFGNNNDEFEITVITIIRKHCEEVSETAFTTRPSKDGKYLALSATVHIDSKEQLDDIYRELSSNPNVLMVL